MSHNQTQGFPNPKPLATERPVRTIVRKPKKSRRTINPTKNEMQENVFQETQQLTDYNRSQQGQYYTDKNYTKSLLKRISQLERDLKDETEKRIYLQENQDERDEILIRQYENKQDQLINDYEVKIVKLNSEVENSQILKNNVQRQLDQSLEKIEKLEILLGKAQARNLELDDTNRQQLKKLLRMENGQKVQQAQLEAENWALKQRMSDYDQIIVNLKEQQVERVNELREAFKLQIEEKIKIQVNEVKKEVMRQPRRQQKRQIQQPSLFGLEPPQLNVDKQDKQKYNEVYQDESYENQGISHINQYIQQQIQDNKTIKELQELIVKIQKDSVEQSKRIRDDHKDEITRIKSLHTEEIKKLNARHIDTIEDLRREKHIIEQEMHELEGEKMQDRLMIEETRHALYGAEKQLSYRVNREEEQDRYRSFEHPPLRSEFRGSELFARSKQRIYERNRRFLE